jgi:hypothetical protein
MSGQGEINRNFSTFSMTRRDKSSKNTRHTENIQVPVYSQEPPVAHGGQFYWNSIDKCMWYSIGINQWVCIETANANADCLCISNISGTESINVISNTNIDGETTFIIDSNIKLESVGVGESLVASNVSPCFQIKSIIGNGGIVVRELNGDGNTILISGNASDPGVITIENAGDTTGNLIYNGLGPMMSLKGVVGNNLIEHQIDSAGENIEFSLSSNVIDACFVTICNVTNIFPNSTILTGGNCIELTTDGDNTVINFVGNKGDDVTLSCVDVEGNCIVANGIGPELTLKKLKAGSNISLIEDDNCITINSTVDRSTFGNTQLTMWMSGFPDQSTSPTDFHYTGTNIIEASGLTGNYSTGFGVRNNHLRIFVNSITSGGNIVFTGTSINETTSLAIPNDIEIITLDTSTSQNYQTSKKWLQFDSVEVTGNTVGLNYDLGIIGYSDLNNTNFTITGYRIEARAGSSGGKTDMTFIIEKVQDDGGGKYSIVEIENLTADNDTNSVIDNLRTGGFDRSYTMTAGEVWADSTFLVMKQGDFCSFFSSKENIIEATNKDEGIIVRITGDSLGAPSGTDYQRVQIRYFVN